ncbi:hypothetical protein NB063_07840 [Rhodopirellula sp. ICT_H3.1]|uniref:Secreted protein n=1 Tax=Aporhodopirellula aestuarii TaxID=2950107 RepID=A0ABT0U0X0_9BACT|nr:hypothetical protein [Aporhodopirellula aestuarii]
MKILSLFASALLVVALSSFSGCGSDDGSTVIQPDPARVDWTPPEDDPSLPYGAPTPQ